MELNPAWNVKEFNVLLDKVLEKHSEKIFKDIEDEFFDFGFPNGQSNREFCNGMDKIKKKYMKKKGTQSTAKCT